MVPKKYQGEIMPTAEMKKIHKEKGIPIDALEKMWAQAKHKSPWENGEPNWAIVQTVFKKEIQEYLRKHSHKNENFGPKSSKSFKKYLNETEELLLEFSKHKIPELIAARSIPLEPGMMRRLGYYLEDEQAYHLTNSKNLPDMLKAQGKRNNHISCFTKGSHELSRLPSQPNVLLLLEGDTVIGGETDIWSLTSERGRRWLDVRDRPGAKKLTFYINGVLQKVAGMIGLDIDVYKMKPEELQETIENLDKSEAKQFYLTYLREMENMLNLHYKELNTYLRSAAEMGYNEVILDKWKILEAWSVDWERPEVQKFCEDNNIGYGGVIMSRDFTKLAI
jgi:hypothetical protein